MRRPRITAPISVTAVLIALAIALTVGWQILVAREFRALTEGFTAMHWVLAALGLVLFAAIVAASLLLAVWLVREIRTSQRQQAFLDAVTHELQTPLASLRLALDTLETRTLAPEESAEFQRIMRHEVERLATVVDHVLRAARAGRSHRMHEPVDLCPLVLASAEEVATRQGVSRERFALDLPAHAWVRGDAEQLRVVVRNLLDNALRHGGGTAPVEVRIRASSDRSIELEVRDRGAGIPRGARRRIFQPFHQAPSAAPGGRRGLGLGLSIVRHIVRDHGGRVRAESDGPGRGSRFVVRLPGRRS